MTTDERAAIAARHYRDERGMFHPTDHCICGQPWGEDGCDTARARALPPDVDALAGVPPFDDDVIPFADLEDENADLRMALGAAGAELTRLRKAAQAVVDWYDGPPYVYLEEEMVRQVAVLRAALRGDTDA